MQHVAPSNSPYITCIQCESTWLTETYEAANGIGGSYSDEFTYECPTDGYHVPECTCACCVYSDCGHDNDKTCFDPNRELKH